MSKIITIKKRSLVILILLFDYVVYLIIGLLLMNYDDFYDESEGEYWSLESMTASEKLTYFGLHFWHLVNIALLIYVVYRIIKRIQKSSIYQKKFTRNR